MANAKKKGRRDEFSARTIKKLQERACHRCSNPDCRVPTAAPGSGPEDVLNTGVACHIAAAAPGGPRYQVAMSQQEREAIQNGIWLCAGCARKIDADELAYPSSTLHAWKTTAQDRARNELNRRLPSEEDAIKQLTTAFTGQAPKYMPAAIRNVHAATEQHLNSLDHRFHVETQYVNRAQSLVIHAREATPLDFHVPADLALAWQQGLATSVQHGAEVTLPTTGLTITGSPLFERLFQHSDLNGGTLVVGGRKKAAMARADLRNPQSGQIKPFRELHGEITFGTESCTFDGTTCGGILAMQLRILWRSTAGVQSFTFGSDFKEWHGLDVRRLPHFAPIYELYKSLDEGWRMGFALEIDGHEVLQGLTHLDMAKDAIRDTRNFLEHFVRVREIAQFLAQPIHYSAERPLDREQFAEVAEIAATIRGDRHYGRDDLTEDPSTTIVLVGEGTEVQPILEHESLMAFRLEMPEEEVLVFETLVVLPKLEVVMTNVRPCPMRDIGTLRSGDAVEVVWSREDGFRCEYRYLPVGEQPVDPAEPSSNPAPA